jgi:type I site-specific restriction-modification system R (restriction) subunit
MPTSSDSTYPENREPQHFVLNEQGIEDAFIEKLRGLKYTVRPDIRDRAEMEANFRQKFEALNRVNLTDGEFARLLEEIIAPDVFTAAKTLRSINAFTRDDGTPLNYTLVNIKDWCENTFEVVHQLRINTDYILDFRQQQDAVDAAIALFSGEKTSQQAREIWLVDKAPVVIQKLETAVQKLDGFLKSQGLDCAPQAVPNLKGDDARAAFINHFKEVQRLKTQLDQYTDLTPENAAAIEQILPKENLLGFRGAYLETAQRLREQRGKGGDQPTPAAVDQIDFEFVLFASAVIDYEQ